MEPLSIREMIEWLESKGHTEEEILDCIRKMVGAGPRKKPRVAKKRAQKK